MDFYIRPVEPRDVMDINGIRRMPGVFENTAGLPSERLQKNEAFIANMGDNSHAFCALIPDDEGLEHVIAIASMEICANPRLCHCADMGIMVHADYQGIGIGSALMETLIDLADQWLMLKRLQLTVFVSNEPAIKLYQKFGFEIEGVNRMGAVRHGAYEDVYMMARIKE